MMTNSKIAIVILNWNGKNLLETFLPSVIQHSSEATIYIADNASTDDSIAFVRTNFPTIQILENKQNFGFAKGYNEALKFVKEPYLCLLNNDVEVTKNWLNPILNCFENNDNVAIIQPKIVDYKNKSHFEYAGAAGGFIDKFGFPYCKGRIFDTIEENIGQYEKEQSIFWASGACFFVQNIIFKNLNGFDEDFFAHQEEIDFCWRAFNEGYTLKYIPNSIVYHVGGATLHQSSPQKTYLNFRNSLYMLVKNLPSKPLPLILFSRLCLDGVAGIKFLFEGNFKHTISILKAHFSLYRNFRKMFKKRSTTLKSNYYQVYSIVFQYYVLKHKLYTTLKNKKTL